MALELGKPLVEREATVAAAPPRAPTAHAGGVASFPVAERRLRSNGFGLGRAHRGREEKPPDVATRNDRRTTNIGEPVGPSEHRTSVEDVGASAGDDGALSEEIHLKNLQVRIAVTSEWCLTTRAAHASTTNDDLHAYPLVTVRARCLSPSWRSV